MTLPPHLSLKSEWALLGPLGPHLPERFFKFPIMGVDGGAAYAQKLDVWVGDSDSGTHLADCEHKYFFPAEKSSSDLSLGLALLDNLKKVILHLWGFNGGRQDHQMINLGEICSFLSTRRDSYAIIYNTNGNCAYRIYSEGEWVFDHRGVFSVASLNKTSLKLTGQCRYQLPQFTEMHPLSSLGLSNEAHGSVKLTSLGPIIVFYPEAP